MKKEILTFIKNGRKSIVNHGPTILTVMASVGLISTIISAVKDTPKALSLIEEERWERDHDDGRVNNVVQPLTKVDIVKLTWKCYIPTALLGAGTLACIIGANSENAKRNAALAAAFSLSDSSFRDYRNKIASRLGDDQAKKIREDVAQDKINNAKIITDWDDIPGDGDVCYDLYTGQLFRATPNKLDKAINTVVKTMLREGYASLNELYYELGMDSVKLGDILGWTAESGYIDIVTSGMLDSKGHPCIAIDYSVTPKMI